MCFCTEILLISIERFVFMPFPVRTSAFSRSTIGFSKLNSNSIWPPWWRHWLFSLIEIFIITLTKRLSQKVSLHTSFFFIDNHPCLAKMPQNKICRVCGIRTAAILKICKLWVHIWVFFVFQKLPTSLLCVNQAEKLKSDLFYPSYNSPKMGTPQNRRHFEIMLIWWPIYSNGKKYSIVFDSELFKDYFCAKTMFLS